MFPKHFMETDQAFTIWDLASKCKSKSELYNMLEREGQIYFPPKQEAIRRFLRDVMMGSKKYLKCFQIKSQTFLNTKV